MATRIKLASKPSVFNKEVEFLSTGCAALDAIMGGGYALGRVANIVGDRSTGKTLLAIEACANLVLKHPKAKIRYVEAESAFDKGYAKALGLPISSVSFEEGIETVEELFADLDKTVTSRIKMITAGKRLSPMLYCVDSMDAISDKAESERGIDQGSYGATKPKKLSELFRRLVRKLNQAKVTVLVISQTRDRIGITFGRKQSRSGGKAMDFYASQVIWLSEVKKHFKVIRGVKRPISVQIKARMDKNKVGLPFRECEFPIVFNFGIDDVTANLWYLQSVKHLGDVGIKSDVHMKRMITRSKAMEGAELEELRVQLSNAVFGAYEVVETSFLPNRRKYG